MFRETGRDVHETLIADRNASLEYCISDGTGIVSIYSSGHAARPFVTMFDNLWEQAMVHDKFVQADHMKDEYIKKQRELYNKLREADRLKDEFIYIAAHELRTPIMPILGGSSSLNQSSEWRTSR